MKSSDKGLLLATLLFCLGLTTSSQAKVCFLVGGCGTDVAGRPCQGAGCADPISDGSKTCEKLGYTRTEEFCCKGADSNIESVQCGNETEPRGDFHLTDKDGHSRVDNLYLEDMYNFFIGKSGIVKVGKNGPICSYIQDESGADNGSGTCDSGGTHYTRRCKCDPRLYQYIKPRDNETDYEIRNPSCTDEGVDGTVCGQHISGETHYMYKVCDPKAGTKVTKYPYTKDARGYTEINSNVLLVNAALDYAHYRLVGNCDTHADGLNKEIHTKSYNETWEDNTNKPTIYDDDQWIGAGNVDGSKGSCEEKYDLRPGKDNVTRYAKCVCPKLTYKYPNDNNVLKSTNSKITLKSHNIGGDKCRDSGTSHDTIDFYTDAACSGQSDVLGAGKINVSPISNGSWKKYEQDGYRCWYDVSKTGNYHLDGAINKVGGLECRVYFPRPCDEFKDAGVAMLEAPAKGYRVRYVAVKDGGDGNHSEDGVNCNKVCYSKAAGLCRVGDYINDIGLCSGASTKAGAETAFENAQVSKKVVGVVTQVVPEKDSDITSDDDSIKIRVVALKDAATDSYRTKRGSVSDNTNDSAAALAGSYTIGNFYNSARVAESNKSVTVKDKGKWGLLTSTDVNSLVDKKDEHGIRLMEKVEQLNNKRSNLFAVLVDKRDGDGKKCNTSDKKYAYADVYQCYWIDYNSEAETYDVNFLKWLFSGAYHDQHPNHKVDKIARAVVAYRDDDGDDQNDLTNTIAGFDSLDSLHARFSYNQHIYMRKVKSWNSDQCVPSEYNTAGKGYKEDNYWKKDCNNKYTYDNPIWYSASDRSEQVEFCGVTRGTYERARANDVVMTLHELLFPYSLSGERYNVGHYIILSYGPRYYAQKSANANATTSSDSGLTDKYGTTVWPKGVQPWRIAVAAGAEKTNSMQWGGACNYDPIYTNQLATYSIPEKFACHMRMYWYGQGYPSSVCQTSERLTKNGSADPTKYCFTETVKGDGGKNWSVRMAENCYIRWDYTHGNCWQTMRWSGDTNPCDSSKERCKIWPKIYSGWDNGWGPEHNDNGTAQLWDNDISNFYKRGIQGCFTRASINIEVSTSANTLRLLDPKTQFVEQSVDAVDVGGAGTEDTSNLFTMSSAELATYKANYISGATRLECKNDECTQFKSVFEGDQSYVDMLNEIIRLRTEVENAQTNFNNAKTAMDNAKTAMDNAKTTYGEDSDEYKSALDAYINAAADYGNNTMGKVKAYNDAVSAVGSAQTALTNAQNDLAAYKAQCDQEQGN